MPAAPDPVIATINGMPIPRDQFVDALIAVSGMKLFNQFAERVVALDACRKAGVPIGPEQVKAEKQRALDNIKKQAESQKQTLTDAQAEQAFNELMSRQGITPLEAEWSFEKTACIRALSKGRGKPVSDEELRSGFQQRYGENVEIRIYQFASIKDAADLKENAAKEKKTFADYADTRRLQYAPVRIPTDKDIEITLPEIKSTALSMAKDPAIKDGEASATLTIGTGKDAKYFVLTWIRKVAPDATVTFASVKEKLRAEIAENSDAAWGQNQLRTLVQTAVVKFNDPILNAQFEQWQRMLQAAATQRAAAAATEPTTAPAPVPAPPAPAK